MDLTIKDRFKQARRDNTTSKVKNHGNGSVNVGNLKDMSKSRSCATHFVNSGNKNVKC